MSVTIKGIPALKANIIAFNRGLEADAATGLDSAADKVVSDAKDICGFLGAVETGSMQKSIRKEKISRPAKTIQRINVRVGGYVVNPKTGRLVDYHVYVHEGTSKMRGRPFLRMAVARNEKTLQDEIAKLSRRRF